MPRYLYGLIFIWLLYAMPAWAETSQDVVMHEIKRTDDAIRDLDRDMNRLKNSLDKLETNITDLKQEETRLRNKLSQDVHTFNVAVATLVRLERQPLEAFLAYDALTYQPRRHGILNMSRKALQQNLDQGRTALGDLLNTLTELEMRREQVRDTQQALAEQRQNLTNLRQEQANLLSLPESERRNLLSKLKTFVQSGDLRNLKNLTTLYSGLMPATHPKDVPQLPVTGVITSTFGSPNPQTGLTENGLRISAIAGEPVKAVKGGRVIYSGPFKGYGYLVILEHEKGVHSLYSGFSRSTRTVGDFIQPGESLGLMPSDNDAPTLYMEVRKDGQPVDPQGWLPKRKNSR